MGQLKQESRVYYRRLGAHVALLRKQRGMTQAELAKLLGVSQQTVFAYELGDRRIILPILLKLADVFSLPVEDILRTKKLKPLPKRTVSLRMLRYAERFQKLSTTQQRVVSKVVDILLREKQSQIAA